MRPLLLLLLLFASATDAAAAPPRKRALLIGINDYTASTLGPRPRQMPLPERDVPDLTGAVNDVEAMAELLVLLHGFDRRDVVTLTDQQATRRAIFTAIERHLLKDARAGDTLFFYYGGHGSQVRNSLSDEPDRMDESLVPADSVAGARDIRDKELRPLFHAMLARGARLTILLDSCHSGSGARGLAGGGARPRSLAPDLRDVADRATAPRPEQRGALVLAASQDSTRAWEVMTGEGKKRGAFTWAFLRAMRDAAPGEPAVETFLRAQARLRGEMPFQEPVLEGDDSARLTPFLGGRADRRGERNVVAVERVYDDGTVVLQGGWAHGLTVGSRVHAVGNRSATLTITAMLGLGRSEARVADPRTTTAAAIAPGALVELSGWATPPGQPLRVWLPPPSGDAAALERVARAMARAAAERGIRWIGDPAESMPTHLLRRVAAGWELLGPEGAVSRAAGDGAAVAAIGQLPRNASLFVHFPAPAVELSGYDDVAIAATPEDAHYLLAGRWRGGRMEHAWVASSHAGDRRSASSMPARTRWVAGDAAGALRDALLRLRRIHGWHQLESPAEGRFPYQLALRRRRGGELVTEGALRGGEEYDLLLRARVPLPARVASRYVYVFAVDSDGRSELLFPARGAGSVENRFPLDGAPPLIALGGEAAVRIGEPYGVDTWFLLTTDEALPNPWILKWDGVRSPLSADALTPLERLLLLAGSSARTGGIVTPSRWSVEKVVFESVSPPVAAARHR